MLSFNIYAILLFKISTFYIKYKLIWFCSGVIGMKWLKSTKQSKIYKNVGIQYMYPCKYMYYFNYYIRFDLFFKSMINCYCT